MAPVSLTPPQLVVAPAQEPAPVAVLKPETAPEKRKAVLISAVVGAVLFVGLVLWGLSGGSKPKPSLVPEKQAQEAGASASNVPAAAPPQTPIPAANAPAAAPAQPVAEAQAEQLKQAAIDLVKGAPGPDGTKTLGQILEAAAPQKGNLSPWLADKIKDDRYQVNYYAAASSSPSAEKSVAYEFKAQLGTRQIEPANDAAKVLMSPPPPAAMAPRGVSKSRIRAKRFKRAARAAKAAAPSVPPKEAEPAQAEVPASNVPAATPPQAGQAEVPADNVPAAAPPQAKQAAPEAPKATSEATLDQLLLPNLPKDREQAPMAAPDKKSP